MVQIKDLVNGAILLISLVAILYLATRYGYVHCSFLPHWCSIYKQLNTAIYGRVYPNIILLYGDSGLGDPDITVNYIRKVCGYHIVKQNVDTVSLGNLQAYDVVIVEHAKRLSAEQLSTLWDFVAGGGKLVMIGDAGTEAPNPDEYLTWKDLGEKNREGIVNPWDRKKEDGTVIRFGTYVLGLKYVGNGGLENEFSGDVYFNEDMMTDGLPRSLDLKTKFAATEIVGSSVFGPQTVAAVISDTNTIDGVKPPFPAIVRIGYRIVYLAYPPEEAGEQHMLIYYNLCKVVT